MTNKQRVHAALEGKPVDRCPVTSLHNFLYQQDHFSELTGLPPWSMHQWLAASPDDHVEIFARMQAAAPFELLQTQHSAPSRAWRARQEFVDKDGHPFRHDRQTGEWVQLDQAAGRCCKVICVREVIVKAKEHRRCNLPQRTWQP